MNRRLIVLNVLNIVLLLIFVRGWVAIRRDWIRFEAKHQPSLIKAGVVPASAARTIRSGQAVAAAADWMDISSKNPFSFDRSDVVIDAKVEEKPVDLGPKPILFGTAFLGKEKEPQALIASGRTPSRVIRPMKVGETIDSWAITRIEEKTVVVQVGAKQETLIINDPTASIPRDSTKTMAVASVTPLPVSVPNPVSTPPITPGTAPSATPSPAPNTPGRLVVTPFGNFIVQ
jgi:hypothetical protein